MTSLHCVKTRDGIGKDEIDVWLAIDGRPEQHVSGPHHLDKSRNDDDVSLGIHQKFNRSVVVRLRERNDALGGANDLILETSDGSYGPAVKEARAVTFSGNNGRVVYTATIGVSA